jgi:hypothetical protein
MTKREPWRFLCMFTLGWFLPMLWLVPMVGYQHWRIFADVPVALLAIYSWTRK